MPCRHGYHSSQAPVTIFSWGGLQQGIRHPGTGMNAASKPPKLFLLRGQNNLATAKKASIGPRNGHPAPMQSPFSDFLLAFLSRMDAVQDTPSPLVLHYGLRVAVSCQSICCCVGRKSSVRRPGYRTGSGGGGAEGEASIRTKAWASRSSRRHSPPVVPQPGIGTAVATAGRSHFFPGTTAIPLPQTYGFYLIPLQQ